MKAVGKGQRRQRDIQVKGPAVAALIDQPHASQRQQRQDAIPDSGSAAFVEALEGEDGLKNNGVDDFNGLLTNGDAPPQGGGPGESSALSWVK